MKIYVTHFEAGDELEIRYVWAKDVDAAEEWAENNKPRILGMDPDLWKVDFIGPARAMVIPTAGDDQVWKTVLFTPYTTEGK